MFVVRVARKDLASNSIPRYDDAKDKLGAIVTAPSLFPRLAKHFQDVAREFGKLAEKQHFVVRMLTSPVDESVRRRPDRRPMWCGAVIRNGRVVLRPLSYCSRPATE